MTEADLNNLLLIATVYTGMVLAAFWLALIVWTYRDIRARTRDTFAQLLAAITVAVLTIPGVFIYILLRPRETLAEAYERSLEEEALLQEIEEKPTCPGCGQRVHDDWQACAYCHTRLKKPCIRCGQLLELSWNLCPHCATSQLQTGYATSQQHYHYEEPQIDDRWLASQSPNTTAAHQQTGNAAESLEFIDGDDY
ncbi:MAG: hypothetical protein D6712_08375 [Chloroflexi bacterium]|nr:MAG: hypothetical protein D6712_08375 [Chloroflexota bacterium]